MKKQTRIFLGAVLGLSLVFSGCSDDGGGALDGSLPAGDGSLPHQDFGNACAGVKCDPHAKCDPQSPTKCKCNPGYQGDGKTCKKIDPCAGVKCDPHAKCDPQSPTKCKCDPGFQGDGKTCKPISTSRRDAVCKRWQDAKSKTVSGGWTPGPSQCDPGKVSQAALDSALRMTNMYRYIAALPAVSMSNMFNAKAQACAVMMKANNTISHYPSTSWQCYTPDGAQAAKSSNLAKGSDATKAVYRFMYDSGNASTLGHRRWIIGNWIGPTGFGTTGSYTCMYVNGGIKSGKTWAAWPPANEVPLAEVFDSTGWSWQSDSINPSGVEVRSDGNHLPLNVNKLSSNYGSKYAISFRPAGWKTQAGKVYNVTITGSQTIKYSVKPVNCP